MPTVAFNICCPRNCVSRHNEGTAGAPLIPLRVDSALCIVVVVKGCWCPMRSYTLLNSSKHYCQISDIGAKLSTKFLQTVAKHLLPSRYTYIVIATLLLTR